MKTGVDTNIVLRWLVDDGSSRDQSAKATKIMGAADIHLSSIALAETVWTLVRVYGLRRGDIVLALSRILDMPNISVDSTAEIRSALVEFERHGGDFNDHFIAALDNAAGCQQTLTFDRKAARSGRFKLI